MKESDFKHIPVMAKETIEFLAVKPDGIYIDTTLGGGGHAEKILVKLSDKGKLIGIDQDGEAVIAAKKKLAKYQKKTIFVHDNFKNLELILSELNVDKVNGILLDLGVSSYQLDNPERGFSFKEDADAILDMRMDQKQKLSAYEVINNYSEEELRQIFFELGEEKFSRQIAREIMKRRREKAIKTVNDLIGVIKSATPPGYRFSHRHHFASKIFRAIRIEVNHELEALREVLPQAVHRLNRGGRLVVISFHSLEDRIVKHFFREKKNEGVVDILTKKLLIPTMEEIALNPRAESAKLRAIEKII
ncbi:MAG: 16S rRNA (cytosine(1402)-N(4))-methyltransferase RsmH [Candidatus Berkelbacteria bacterium]|nr:16S rRNA (cytosine(1402)-N(4))-methyltransferase RsmH [Candidatus Berkelbacteria bacterium]